MSLGKRVRELRREQRITQRELADRLQAEGLEADFTYISKIENDNLQYPPSEKLIRGLAKILQTDPEELLDLAGKFDQKLLQELVAEFPPAGVLLRRLQSGQISREDIKRIVDGTGEQEQK
jgi:HTH-type transcriptional regulator, competence development regulator